VDHERFEGERTLMRIHIGESDHRHGKPLYQAIVNLCRSQGFSGVTVLRGVGGYGSSSRYHTDTILRLSQDLPVIMRWWSIPSASSAFCPNSMPWSMVA
jgi:PII-like signaling protein